MSFLKVPLPVKRPKYKVIQDYKFIPIANDESTKSALNYKPKPNDLFIVTYPKSGTTWTMQICMLLLNDGELPEEVRAKDFFARIPFLELMGSKAIDDACELMAIMTHLPFQLVPYNPKTKYIYVARNPKDVCVSCYFHNKSIYEFDGSFHEFMLFWLNGEVFYGSYKDHMLSWWEHKNDDNVLFLLYEEMKENIRGVISKIASFVGEEYKIKLEKNPEIMEKIVEKSEFSFMKQTTNKSFENFFSSKVNIAGNLAFIRKGIIGDWKNHFTEEENEIFEKWFQNSFSGTGVERLWDKSNVFTNLL
ncbi:sulfotransferase-like protein [Dinothrombium tinctorium]|uniref:Sulfotransferase-like protein n=1 Tax=Dinothrombium tinctorium TaxID=1965070 RepID=A0A443QHY4_9ACAR|nr:sulfotransferase-like protein [Dinothrombium tinctorium]